MFAESLIALVGALSLQATQETPANGFVVQELPVAKYAAPAVVPEKKRPESLGMEITAKAGLVMDVDSGEVLFEKNGYTAYPIASLTKLMTAMTFLDHHPNLDEQVTVTPDDMKGEGKSVFFPNERMTKRELLQALLVGSVNAAGNALARSTGDEKAFVEAMNVKARALGLREAFFADPTGLDRQNRASAREVAIIMKAALEYPEIRETTGLSKIEIKSRIGQKPYLIKSTNLLLSSFLNKTPYRIVAAKTGSLPEAGFCFAQATEQGSRRVITVVLGSENHFDRFQDAKALTFWAFDTFQWTRISRVDEGKK
jgi:serine-type D-Ala-D-Ala endopeptidase (penicillin-binding protein 7)